MKVDISLGELVDKVTILAIKLEKIKNPGKLENVKKEYEMLSRAMALAGLSDQAPEFERLFDRLVAVNRKLWEIEDMIREKEAAKQFDGAFVELARSVYFTNDERAAIKREINAHYGSEWVEEKEYAGY